MIFQEFRGFKGKTVQLVPYLQKLKDNIVAATDGIEPIATLINHYKVRFFHVTSISR